MSGRVARLILIGVATGLASGLLGVGGGFVMVPALVMLGTPQREANGTSLAVILPVAIVGASILGHGHQVDLEVGIALAIGAVGGAVVGARLTRRLSDLVLRRAFGIMALAVGIIMIADAALRAVGGSVNLTAGFHPTGISLWVMALVVGAVAGVLSGLLGIGGGAVMVPAMTLLIGLSQHVAQGTSLLVIIPTAISGSITHFRMGNIRLQTAGWLSVGGVLGAVAGALLALASPDQLLRFLFGAYLAFTGVRMLQAPKTKVTQPTMASR
ncbi:MAG TPA: sulfite exporter TauE/SafE family protein [Candidatus Dormibacteraeota bacterium]|nr:sulfite exporter TauE/SafE family protein [Candidatus Dormibacteraeota bacterium]